MASINLFLTLGVLSVYYVVVHGRSDPETVIIEDEDDPFELLNITTLNVLEYGYELVSFYNYYYPFASQSVVLVDIYNITCYISLYYVEQVCFYSVRFGNTECQKEIPSGIAWTFNRRKKRKTKAKAAAAAVDNSTGTTKALKTTKTKTTKTKTTKTPTKVTDAPIFTVLNEECNAGRQKNPVEQFDLDARILWEGWVVNMSFTIQGENPETKNVYYDLYKLIFGSGYDSQVYAPAYLNEYGDEDEDENEDDDDNNEEE